MTQSPPPPVQQLIRRSVPNDNSCLFYALAYLCEDAEPSKKVEQTLREICAESALVDPDPVTRALFLGQPTVQDYSEWIRNSHHWGGEQEVVALAEHYSVEVVVVSCESLTTLCYASQKVAAKHRVYILYTGQHYDPLVGAEHATSTTEETRRFGVGENSVLEASAHSIAKQHNIEAARKAKQRRVTRIKCGGCGALLDDAAAFQAHCMDDTVIHDDDFAFDCEAVEVVVEDGEALPEGAVDLTDETKYCVYYNADVTSPLSSAHVAKFAVDGITYPTFEHYWQSIRYATSAPELAAKIAATDTVQAAIMMSHREGMDIIRPDWDVVQEELLLQGLRAQCSSNKSATTALLATAPKTIVCVDVDPYKGMTATGGIATGRNHFGQALEVVRTELLGGGRGDSSGL